MTNAGELLLNQFQWKKCLPRLEDKTAIFDSMWDNLNFKPYLVYRIFIGLFAFVYIIFDICWETLNYYHNFGFWLIYATNWAFLIFSATFIILAVNSAIKFWKPQYEFSDNYCHVLFVLYTIMAISALTVGLVYWVALYAETGIMQSFEARVKHTIPSIIVLIDLMTNRIIIELAHIIYPITCGCIYIIFNVIYYHAGGKRYDNKHFVYETIDWTNNESATTACLIVLMFAAIIHGILFLVSFLKFMLKVSLVLISNSINTKEKTQLIK